MKNILITGSTSGIGLQISKTLKKENLNVFNASRKNGFDLSKKETISKIVNFIQEKEIDTLFLNSGIIKKGLVGSFSNEDVSSIFEINTISNIKIINKIIDKIADNKIKVIVTLSTAAHINGASESIYSASKKALKDFIISSNTEIIENGKTGYIFYFSPPFISGTKLSSDINTPTKELAEIVDNLISSIKKGEHYFVPKYKEIYKRVFDEFKQDPIKQGMDSIKYRKSKGRWVF